MGNVVDVGHIRYTRWDTRKLMAKGSLGESASPVPRAWTSRATTYVSRSREQANARR